MSRYIDADALTWLVEEYKLAISPITEEQERDNRLPLQMLTEFENIIAKQPTVDAVPVVRKPIRGYEGMYEVDNLARVFSVERVKTVNDNGRVYDKPIQAKQLRQGMHSKGYKVVTLTKDGVSKTHFVHRLVAEAFIENPNGLPMINHKDEDKTNNLPENLEWCDAYYNVMYGNGRKKRSKKIKGVPLSEEHKRKISESLKRFYCADGERRTE
jgi:hypothetical protein